MSLLKAYYKLYYKIMRLLQVSLLRIPRVTTILTSVTTAHNIFLAATNLIKRIDDGENQIC